MSSKRLRKYFLGFLLLGMIGANGKVLLAETEEPPLIPNTYHVCAFQYGYPFGWCMWFPQGDCVLDIQCVQEPE